MARPVKAQLCRSTKTNILILFLLSVGIIPGWFASAQQISPAPLDGNASLDRRLQVTAEGATISNILALLSRKADVDLSASAYVAEDKVVLFGPPRPLRNLLVDLAVLFNDKWIHTKTSDGKDHYLLTRSPEAKNYENALASSIKDQMLAAMEEQIRALDESQEQLLSRPQNDPIRASLLNNDRRLATRFYATLDKEQRLYLFEHGHTANYAFQALTLEQQGLLRLAFAARILREQQLAAEENVAISDGNVRISDNIRISRVEELERGAIRVVLLSQTANSADLRLQMSLTANLPIRHLYAVQKRLSIHGNPYTLKLVTDNASLPSPDTVAASFPQQYWIDSLHKLSQTSGVQVLSDYYRCASTSNVPDDKDETHAERTSPLDHLCRSRNYLWWVQDKSLMFRYREWYVQRLYEVPDKWIADTSSRILANKGVPTYRDVSRLQHLTSSQLVGLQRLVGLSVESERELDGLSQLLDVISEAAFSDANPIPQATISPRLPQEELNYDLLSVIGQNMLQPFWANAYPVVAADLHTFRVRLSYNYPTNSTPQYEKQARTLNKEIASRNAEGVDATLLKKQLLRLQMQHIERQGIGESKGARFVFLNLDWRFGSTSLNISKSAAHVALPMFLPEDRNDSSEERIRISVPP